MFTLSTSRRLTKPIQECLYDTTHGLAPTFDQTQTAQTMLMGLTMQPKFQTRLHMEKYMWRKTLSEQI